MVRQPTPLPQPHLVSTSSLQQRGVGCSMVSYFLGTITTSSAARSILIGTTYLASCSRIAFVLCAAG